ALSWARGRRPAVVRRAGAAARVGRPSARRGRRLVGRPRADTGRYLRGLWWLPAGIVEDVRHVDEPSRADPSRWGTIAVLHAADRLVKEATNPEEPAELDLEFLAQAGVASKIDLWRAPGPRGVETGGARPPPAPPSPAD